MTAEALVLAVRQATGLENDLVRSELTAIDVLEEAPTRPRAPRLLLTKISFDGALPVNRGGRAFHYERDLAGGVNLWKAPNLRGKSTILRSIRWALTGGVGGEARKPQDWIQAVMLEFTLDGVAHRIQFTHVPPRAHDGAIERWDGRAWVTVESFKSQAAHDAVTRLFFARAFGLDRLSWTQHKANSLEVTEGHATWATYFQGLFLDEQSYDELIGGVGPVGKVAAKVLAALLGLPEVVRLNRLQLALDGLNITSERAKLARAEHGGTEVSLAKARDTLSAELQSLMTRLDAQPTQTDLQSALQASDAARAAFVLATGAVADLEEEVSTRAAARAGAAAQRRLLQDSIEFKIFFNGIEVTHCPRCEQEVDEEAKARESTQRVCRVCTRAVPGETDDAVAALRSELEVAEQRVAEAQQAEDAATRRLDSARRALEKSRADLGKAREELQAASVGAAPLLERRDELNMQIGQAQGRLGALRVPTDAELEQRRTIYLAAQRELKAAQDRDSADLLEAFSRRAVQLAHDFGLSEVQEVRYDPDHTVLITEAGERTTFEKFSGGGQQRLKIAILLAVAILALERPEVRHPRLLFIDAPGGHEMIEDDAAAIARALRTLDGQHSGDVQVLVASALDELVEATVPAKRHVASDYLF